MRKMAVVAAFGLALTGCGSAGPSAAPSTTATASAPIAMMSATASTGEVVLTLDKPATGTAATGHLEVSGTAAAFEANVPWTLANADSHQVVRTGHFTAQECCKLAPFSGTVSLTDIKPGNYLFTVTLDDPSGGEGKPVPQIAVPITVQ